MTDDAPRSLDSDHNPLRLSEQLCFALYSTSRAITKKYASLLDDLGVTYPQYLSLMALWERDGLTINELGRLLELEGATTTPLVKRLEKLDLVRRERSAEDERRVHIFLTDKGKSYRERALSVPEALGCAMDIDDLQAKRLIKQMQKLKNSLVENE